MSSPVIEPATTAASTLYFGPWYRRSPFFEKTLAAGCSAYDIYNHMYLPGYYDDPDVEYRALNEAVTLWDVGVERTVQVSGPDADLLIDRITGLDHDDDRPRRADYLDEIFHRFARNDLALKSACIRVEFLGDFSRAVEDRDLVAFFSNIEGKVGAHDAKTD